jgi:glycosyltransferase involved in cell wall biosynthesis
VSAVHVVVPDGIDDQSRPSGGNTYDRRICSGLAAIGWTVDEHAVAGAWPCPDDAACRALAALLDDLPDGGVVLLDGLIASTVPDVLVPQADRLRLVVLVHMPLGNGPSPDDVAGKRERLVLEAATATVTTSRWTRDWLLERYALAPTSVHVAEPGVDAADLAPGSTTGGNLLCVAAVTPAKGHDVLLSALATIPDLPWRCDLVGSLERDPAFVDLLRAQARDCGIGDRVHFAGSRTGADLDAAYAAADALVLASSAETYGMVVTEALARGLPVVTTTAGGLPEALGRGADGIRPGLLVPPGDPVAFAAALRRWLDDVGVRRRLRLAASERRTTLLGWSTTTERLARVLTQAGA